jgi:transglutaminase-like putative cysteine protease
MHYRVRHITRYEYESDVALSHNQMRLSPRSLAYQKVEWPQLTVQPEPTCQRAWVDFHGNRTHFFSIEQSHRVMEVSAESLVERTEQELAINSKATWESLAARVEHPRSAVDIEASMFRFDSRYVRFSREVQQYARPSFAGGRSMLDAAKDLTARIFQDFEYDPNATHVSTPTLEVLQQRRGVCQDFAHLQIAALRSMGLAARYVSGYLLTQPPPGQTKLVGSDASHAWISVYFGDGHWLDFDPTNNLIPGDEHITIGWGRDYADICPIQGILIGGGQSRLRVSVDVLPISSQGE